LAAAYMRPNEFIMRFEQFSETQIKFIKFALFGGVVFTWGILLNFFTVEVLQTDKRFAYLFVIISQILICFFLNRYVIFENGERNLFQTFSGYLAALAIFRMADWTLYVIQINWLDLPYLLAQTVNNFLIFFTKFPIYRIIFESRPPRREMHQ
jgi:putative flippase GtrA